MNARTMRRNFLLGLWLGVRVVWPILSGLLILMMALGVLVGRLEHWAFGDSLYFTFITGLSIGYGDLTPKTLLTRFLAVVIGIVGMLAVALVAAIAVKAFNSVKASVRLDAD